MADELIVIAEQQADVVVLRRLLDRALHLEPAFYSGRGRMTLGKLARNILVHEGGPVLVVMDAHTTHLPRAEEARGMMHFAISQLADESTFDVHAFLPQLDVIFYEAACVLQRHLGRAVGRMELELGLLDPRRQLDRLLAEAGTDRDAFYRVLDDADLDRLLAGEQMKALIAGADALLGRHDAIVHA